eukprot:5699233-Amphidinium_carterae.1
MKQGACTLPYSDFVSPCSMIGKSCHVRYNSALSTDTKSQDYCMILGRWGTMLAKWLRSAATTRYRNVEPSPCLAANV